MKTNTLSLKERTNPAESLLELMREAQAVALALSESGGELTPELEARLEMTGENFPRKVDSYRFIMDQLEATEALLRRKEESFAKLRKAMTRQRERMEERVQFVMGELGTKELRGKEYRFYLRGCQQRLVINEELLPSSWKIQITETAPDKERIKTALKEGFSIEGAQLLGGASLQSVEITEES